MIQLPTPEEYLNSKGIKYRTSRDELILAQCPFCGTKEQKFSINKEKGAYQCFKASCEASEGGHLVELMRHHGDDPYPKKKKYEPVDQNKFIAMKPPEAKKDSFVQWVGKYTSLTEKSILGYNLRCKKEGEREYLIYPYFENGVVVDLKYRNVKDKKDMRTEKAAKKVFFGQQLLKKELDYCFITEGEKDACSMYEFGYENCLSVPNGAKGCPESMFDLFKEWKPKRVYIVFDNDEAGKEGSKRLASKIGPWRCLNVLLPYKDANECWQNGMEKVHMDEYINNSTKFNIEADLEHEVFKQDDELLEEYQTECRKNQIGIKFGIPLLDIITGGMFPGQMMGICAGPGTYKTVTAQNLLIKSLPYLRDDEFAGIFSMEMSATREFQRRLQIKSGYSKKFLRESAKNGDNTFLRLAEEMIQEQHNLLVCDRSNLNVENMVKIIQNTEDKIDKKCRIIAIDYLDYIDPVDSRAFNPIGDIMQDINKKLAKKLGISVILLVQTNRPHLTSGDYGVSIGDGKGGRSIEQELDVYFGLFRDKDLDVVRGNFLKHRDYEIDKSFHSDEYPFPYFNLITDKLTLIDFQLIPLSQIKEEQINRKQANKQKIDVYNQLTKGIAHGKSN